MARSWSYETETTSSDIYVCVWQGTISRGLLARVYLSRIHSRTPDLANQRSGQVTVRTSSLTLHWLHNCSGLPRDLGSGRLSVDVGRAVEPQKPRQWSAHQGERSDTIHHNRFSCSVRWLVLKMRWEGRNEFNNFVWQQPHPTPTHPALALPLLRMRKYADRTPCVPAAW